jgi:predicted RNA-binding protein (virulence factor B family)
LIEIGKYHLVTVKAKSGKGWDLLSDTNERIFLPDFETDLEFNPGDEIEVFVYRNHRGDLTGSTKEANVLVNTFGYLKVKSNSNFGAFMDWGISKDLLIPLSQQHRSLESNGWYIVYCYLDEKTGKLAGSTKTNHFLKPCEGQLAVGDKVEILVVDESDLGINVIVENAYRGLIFRNENFKDLHTGDRTIAFVKNIREDGKIDIRLNKEGLEGLDESAKLLLEHLEANNGFLPLTDKSAPEDIYEELEMSKKAFKRSVGILYKQRKISIDENGIQLIS